MSDTVEIGGIEQRARRARRAGRAPRRRRRATGRPARFSRRPHRRASSSESRGRQACCHSGRFACGNLRGQVGEDRLAPPPADGDPADERRRGESRISPGLRPAPADSPFSSAIRPAVSRSEMMLVAVILKALPARRSPRGKAGRMCRASEAQADGCAFHILGVAAFAVPAIFCSLLDFFGWLYYNMEKTICKVILKIGGTAVPRRRSKNVPA